MKNRIIFKSIVTGILSASLVLESIFPAFGVNIDKEAITRYYYYKDALREANGSIVKLEKAARLKGGFTGGDSNDIASAIRDYKVTDESLLGEMSNTEFTQGVNVTTGNFLLADEDVSLSEDLSVYYNSMSYKTGLFGFGRSFVYDESINQSSNVIIYRRYDGACINFTYNEGLYYSNLNPELSIKKEPSGEFILRNDIGGILERFDEDGKLLEISDLSNNKTQLLYNNGKLSKIIFDEEKTYDIQINNSGFISEISSADINLKYDYDDDRLVSVTNTSGEKIIYKYDVSKRLANKFDNEDKEAFRISYNTDGRVKNIIIGNDKEVSFNYLDGKTEVLDEKGSKDSYFFDEKYRVIGIESNDSTISKIIYDKAINAPEALIDAFGNFTAYSYDDKGRITSITDANGGLTKYAYKDGIADPVEFIDEYGAKTENSYDDSGNFIGSKFNGNRVLSIAYDDSGNISSITDALGDETKYEWDESGRVIAQIDAMGNRTGYSYVKNENISTVTLADGNVYNYTYDDFDRLISQEEPNGLITNIEYDSEDRIIRIFDNKDLDEKYTYDNSGNLLTETNSLGEIIRYKYNSDSRITNIAYADGTTESFSYDEVGNLISSTDIFGTVTTYTYDAFGNLTKETTGDDFTEYTYDGLGQVLSEKDGDGATVLYTYDVKGNITQAVDALGNIKKFSYDINNNLIMYTDGNNNPILYRYDALGRNTEIIYPNGASEKYQYDALGNITEITDVDGKKVTYSYDSLLRITRKEYSTGEYEKYIYDAVGNITSIIDNAGNEIKYNYDLYGQIIEENNSLGERSTYSYDKIGQIVNESNSEGEFNYTYDTFGNILEESNSWGEKNKYEYDSCGQLKKENLFSGDTYSYEYDKISNLIKEIHSYGGENEETLYTVNAKKQLLDIKNDKDEVKFNYDAKGQLVKKESNAGVEKFSYDGNGNLISITGVAGDDTYFTYSPRNLVTSVTPNEVNTKRPETGLPNVQSFKVGDISYKTNTGGDLLEFTDGNFHITQFIRDNLSRVIKRKNPLGDIESYEYGEFDTPVRIIKADGTILEYTYDKEGQITAQSRVMGGEKRELARYRYDSTGNVTEAVGEAGTSTYEYDLFGNITKYTDSFGKSVNYNYDTAGNLIKVQIDTETPVQYTYDEVSRITAVTYGENKTVRYEYADNTTATYLPNGEIITETVNENGELVNKSYKDTSEAVIAELTIYYDDNERIVQKAVAFKREGVSHENGNEQNQNDENNFQKITYQYTYTDRGELSSCIIINDEAVEDISYTYDNAGNRLSETHTSGDKTENTIFKYDENNRLIEKSSPDGITLYTYDKNGNRISAISNDEKYTYVYDYNDNLIEVKKNDIKVFEAVYDAMGERTITRSLDSETGILKEKRFINDVSFDNTQVLKVYGENNESNYLYGNERIAKYSNDFESFYFSDNNDSVLAKFGVSKDFFAYTPFGIKDGNEEDFGFDGEWSDNTKLYYLRARYYSPSDGVFLSEDSFEGELDESLSLNGYSFVENDPVNYNDPAGYRKSRSKGSSRSSSKRTTSKSGGSRSLSSKISSKSGLKPVSRGSKLPKLKSQKSAPKRSSAAPKKAKTFEGKRVGKASKRQSSAISRNLARSTTLNRSRNSSRLANKRLPQRVGRFTPNKFARAIRSSTVITRRASTAKKLVKSKIPARNYARADAGKIKTQRLLRPVNTMDLKPKIYVNGMLDKPKTIPSKWDIAYSQIQKNTADLQNKFLNNPIAALIPIKAYGAGLGWITQNIRVLDSTGFIKFPNTGIYYDNVRNALIKGSTQLGNDIYARNIPLVSNYLGSFLGATNMPVNAGFMSMWGAHNRGIFIDGLGGTLDGIGNLIVHPLDTLEGIAGVMENPEMVLQTGTNYVNEKLIHGTMESRANFVGRLKFEVAMFMVGSAAKTKYLTKGASSIAKVEKELDTAIDIAKAFDKVDDAGKAIDKVSDTERAAKVAEITNNADDVVKHNSIAEGIAKNVDEAANAGMAEEPKVKLPDINKPNDPKIEVPEINKISETKPVKPILEIGENTSDAVKAGKGSVVDDVKPGDKKTLADKVDDVAKTTDKAANIKEAIQKSDNARKWGVLEDGTNQGVKHFSEYWDKFPERIPSLEERLGVAPGDFNNSLEGFNNFTEQAEKVVREAELSGNVRNINGKSIYYIDGAAKPKKGVVVIVKDGKFQSMMPSDIKSFNNIQ
ncbi:RHS repeat-associated core domain protein [Lachnoanaerobaculum sp. ICM7]|jgi:putative uncharacterized protein (fragment)|uniref:RHS repeat-associated core domain-containing protein n=1 Tax=Lachnoanaerobaculum sp. ICM7 TaxID=936594 RepID=UPI00027A5792|nr:RHS repeat-associated core domain-containing protein [Lachnoanaerobaculum sp. ICM7]EJP23767.1 RHS repeat-associated core domain protein [Lachnoanaerobaculum sp. ICM7]